MSAFDVFPMTYQQKILLAGIIRGLSEPPEHGNHRWARQEIDRIQGTNDLVRGLEKLRDYLHKPLPIGWYFFDRDMERVRNLPRYAFDIEIKPFPGVFRPWQ